MPPDRGRNDSSGGEARRHRRRGPRVLVCRGCCCGTTRKHPDVDHDEQVARLRSACAVRVVGCVDECAHSNVVIVRRPSQPSLWLGGLLDPSLTEALRTWLARGAAGPVPASLRPHVFERRSLESPVALRARD